VGKTEQQRDSLKFMVHTPWRIGYINYKSIKYKKKHKCNTLSVLVLLYDVSSEDSINHEIICNVGQPSV